VVCGDLGNSTTDHNGILPMRSSMSNEPWVSLEEIATHLGVSKDTVHRWIRRRKMPAHKVGHLWKFQVSEVDDWVRAGKADEKDGE
jgi:excisionase family DNA binding protein